MARIINKQEHLTRAWVGVELDSREKVMFSVAANEAALVKVGFLGIPRPIGTWPIPVFICILFGDLVDKQSGMKEHEDILDEVAQRLMTFKGTKELKQFIEREEATAMKRFERIMRELE
jgi:hypothetical protein